MSLLNNVTILLLISHVLGDYHFQSETMSEMKQTSLRTLAKHLGIHALTLVALSILLFDWSNLLEISLLLLSVWLTHCVIDLVKFSLNRFDRLRSETIYIVDQILHVVAILLLSEKIFSGNLNLRFLSIDVLRWVLLLLVITKPANITFKKLFQRFHFKTDATTIPGAGAIIGNLERILSVLFLTMNQITAIGFIYTAKSIARSKKLRKIKDSPNII